MSPIGWAFLAGAVGFAVIDEMIDRPYRFIDRFGQSVGIVFEQHETLEYAKVTPRVPVVYHISRLVIHGHPPEMIGFKIRFQDTLLHFVAHSL